jgi:hypothetical protein
MLYPAGRNVRRQVCIYASSSDPCYMLRLEDGGALVGLLSFERPSVFNPFCDAGDK